MDNQKPFRAYLVEMSNKRSIKIDEDEVGKVYEAISTGNPVKVRQGIINPSFLVDVVFDEERVNEIKGRMRDINLHNNQDRLYQGGKNQRVFTGMEKLSDILKDAPIIKKLSTVK